MWLAIGDEHHGHASAHGARFDFDFGNIAQTGGDVLHLFEGQIAVGHFPATEEHGELDFVAVVEEIAGAVDLDAQVVVVDFGTDADFLELGLLGVGASFLLFFALLVFPLAIVHDLADRGLGLGCDFHEIKARVECPLLGFVEVGHTDLFVLIVDESNGRQANLIVDSELLTDFLGLPWLASFSDGELSKKNTYVSHVGLPHKRLTGGTYTRSRPELTVKQKPAAWENPNKKG